MRITAFNGSPRGKNSNTGLMVTEFLDGAAKAGADTEQIFLSQKKIGHCMGCFKCWTATPGKCVIRDDMTDLLEKVISTDLIIMATPLYIDDVTGIMKDFMDRLIPLSDPHFEQDVNDEWIHVKRFSSYPDIAVISNCG
ncbi:MAG: flavodoxin family protein, partial [Candidatus Fermentibacteraceae bacterium]|nr:flavodoxin family protein [Candidatus Fermentibacteraceae bacterium]